MTECGQFWCHLAEKRSTQELQWISAFLNDDKNKLIKEVNPKVGEFCAAPFQSGNSSSTMNYRAKILKLLPNDMVKVLFIDYGNEATVPSVSLRSFGIHTMNMMAKRPLAFQCTLSEVKPSLLKDQRAIWTDEANTWFFNKTRQQNLLGKVYSVTHSIVHLELFIGNESINQMLIKEGYAEPKEESYASKMNREMRITADTMHPLERNALNKTQEKENMNICEEPCDPPSRVMCTHLLTLSGPHSPLETKVYGLMNISRNKSTLIDPLSINSVLLNTDPQQRNERLLVTADIDQSSEGSKLNLRQTTLMPNIPGFPALLAMLFCPTAELRRNATGKRYSSVLCGLGHSDGTPLFREHDLLINIDVDFSENDINNINHLRFNMDCMMSDNSPPNMTLEVFQSNAQCKIQSLILGMISTPRKHVEVCAVPNGWQWNSTVGTDLLFAPSYADLAVFPLHNGLALNKMTSHDLYLRYVENKRIHNLCQGYLSKGDQEIFCKLCDLGPFNVTSLRLHLHSLNHKMWEAELPVDEEVQQ